MKKKSIRKTTVKRGKKKAVKSNVLPKYVLAPGGYRVKSLVKRAPQKKKIGFIDNQLLVKTKPSVTSLIRRDFLIQPESFITHLGLSVHDVHNPHWVAYAGWQNNIGRPLYSFAATWIVPPPPVVINRQILYLFSGMQNDFQILQPVLQWGLSAAGGGRFWSVASWFAAGQADPVRYSGLTRVEPGERLTAVIQMTDLSNNQFSYSSFFQGIDRSRLDVHSIPELKYCSIVLETYGINVRENYPVIPQTAVGGISLRDQNHSVTAGWETPSGIGRFGEHAEVRRIPGSADEIDLFY